ncbi:hypothetical protein J6590_071652 [Homalodisca vitripennis]|nr:hypothetical protein J6590_071652 [Homalodisca vitripennis]
MPQLSHWVCRPRKQFCALSYQTTHQGDIGCTRPQTIRPEFYLPQPVIMLHYPFDQPYTPYRWLIIST